MDRRLNDKLMTACGVVLYFLICFTPICLIGCKPHRSEPKAEQLDHWNKVTLYHDGEPIDSWYTNRTVIDKSWKVTIETPDGAVDILRKDELVVVDRASPAETDALEARVEEKKGMRITGIPYHITHLPLNGESPVLDPPHDDIGTPKTTIP